MAKKKTKATSNPNRGFATTSVVSKSKVGVENDDAAEKSEPETPTISATNALQNPTEAVDQQSEETPSGLAHLTPEELELELEKNELQILVDKHGARVRRDVQRQLSKMQTDLRTLRGQAQAVNVPQSIDDDVVNVMIEMVRKDVDDGDLLPVAEAQGRITANEELLARCWTLSRMLSAMAIEPPRIEKIVKALIRRVPNETDMASIWGLDEAFVLLALENDLQLPNYDKMTDMTLIPQIATRELIAPPVQNSVVAERLQTSLPFPGDTATNTNGETIQTAAGEDTEEGDLEVSDLDSDLEPDQLIPKYLSTKQRLFELRPDLVDSGAGTKRRQKAPSTRTATTLLTPGLRKLQGKIQRIESDPFFDQQHADVLWVERRNDIAQVAALNRRLQSTASRQPIGITTKTVATTGSQTVVAPTISLGEDDVDGLSNLFESTMAHDTAKETSITAEPLPPIAQRRDFGKMTGIPPSRVLEDACRARDTRVKLVFRHNSRTPGSCRSSVTVSWNKDQERLEEACPPFISMKQTKSGNESTFVTAMTFAMEGVSTSDPAQSEGFIATLALFKIFSDSPADGRANIRLPAAYRDLWLEFERWKKEQTDAEDRRQLASIRSWLETQQREDDEDGVVLTTAFRGRSRAGTPLEKNRVIKSKPDHSEYSEFLVNLWQAKSSTATYQRMFADRMMLPMFGFREAALDAIAKHQVLILCGETGCGKSTQMPAYILEHELSQGRDCKIYCTEPRRISAISLAQRVSEELGENKGDVGTPRSLVGYAIRLETKVAAQSKLIYATVGIVLRMLESSESLEGITHLIIDEVHERSIDTDFLLIVLRSLMRRRPALKVILMSATVDATRFSRYLDDAPIVNVPGRTFPVKTLYLEDAIEMTGYRPETKKGHDVDLEMDEDSPAASAFTSSSYLQDYRPSTREVLAQFDEYRIDFDLITTLVKHVLLDPSFAPYSKAILVFLPGIGEIRELDGLLRGESLFQHNCVVYPLHSSIASEEQQAAFLVPPPGVRKIVLATNIAETGITIPDVTCVIDTGKHKEMRFDERRQLSRLIVSFISKANAKQRRGRAGRVQEGLCFHLFSRQRHDETMAEQQAPEMLRLSLQDLVMRVKICNLGDIDRTLAQALDPPSSKNVRRAIDALIEAGAMTTAQDLTTLGGQLAKLPIDANLGKFCLLSAIFFCLDVGLTVAAILSSKSPFVTPFNQRQAADLARLSFSKWNSDLLTAYNAYASWRRVSLENQQNIFSFCKKNFLSHQNLTAIEDLKGQLFSAMTETGLVPVIHQTKNRSSRGFRPVFVQIPPGLNRNNDNEYVVTSVIAWSFYPKLLQRDGKGWRQITNAQSISLHPQSVNKSLASVNTSSNAAIRLLSYYSLVQTTSGTKAYNALSSTPVTELGLLLLAGKADFKLFAGVIHVDGHRLRCKVAGWRLVLVLKVLRRKMEAFVDARLAEPKKEVDKALTKWLGLWERIAGIEPSV